MKLHKSQLKQIIKEELEDIFAEGLTDEEEKQLKKLKDKEHE